MAWLCSTNILEKGGNFSVLYNLGKTSVHESGHYFDLMHTWGGDGPGEGGCDDDDGIKDTPDCSLSYFSSPVSKCFHPVQCGNSRMIENFLDYSSDGCLTLFTPGQAAKMISAIQKYRTLLVSAQNLSNCGCSDLSDSLNNVVSIDLYPTIVNNDILSLHTKSMNLIPLRFNIYDLFGRLLFSFDYEKVGNQTIEAPLNQINGHLRPGVYIIRGTFGNSFQKKFIIAVK